MKLHLSALVPASLCLGFVLALLLPAEWLPNVFLWGLGIVFVLAVANAASAQEKPLGLGAKIVSYVALGTSRPNAVIKIGPWLAAFLCAAAALLGLGGGLIWLARV